MARRKRPPLRTGQIVALLAWSIVTVAVPAAAITALIAYAARPISPALWIPLFIALYAIVGLLFLRLNAPEWIDWILGRPPRGPGRNRR